MTKSEFATFIARQARSLREGAEAATVRSAVADVLPQVTDRTVRLLLLLAMRALARSESAASPESQAHERRVGAARLQAAYRLVNSGAFRERAL